MKRNAPIIAVVLSLLYAFSGARVPKAEKDAAAFGSLPVLHGGRIKPMDSVARTTLLVARGKQKIKLTGEYVRPMRWMLTLWSNPTIADEMDAFRIDDPDVLSLIGKRSEAGRYHSFAEIRVAFKAVETQYQRAAAVEGKLRTRFERAVVNLFSRLNLYIRAKRSIGAEGTAGSLGAELAEYSKVVEAAGGALSAHSSGTSDDPEAMRKVMTLFSRYRTVADDALVRPVPPRAGAGKDDWRNFGEALLEGLDGKALSPAVGLYWKAIDAYRMGDMDGFRSQIEAIKVFLEAEAPAAAALARKEALFNRMDLFTKGMALYVFGFLAAALFWLKGGEKTRQTAFALVSCAFAVHTIGMIARMYLGGRPPVTNLYSSAVFVGWGAVAIGVALERWHKNAIGSASSAIVGFATLVVAHHLSMSGDTMEMMQAVLDSNFWLATHVITITIGYSSVFLAGALAHVYLIGEALGKIKKPTKKAITQMVYGVTCFSLLFSFVGTVLGGIWADQSWGRFWGWDPKENGALLIVLWLSIMLHARFAGIIREPGLMVGAVFANIVTAMAWFGVNMLGVGLHSYGFMDKAAVWLLIFTASQLLIMSLVYFDGGKLAHLLPGNRSAKSA
jgi:ABC-type transport system involved in cytochrome c biogenesis permease subunit